MQIDHVLTAGRLVQPIDVLRDEHRDLPAALQRRQRVMGVVRACAPQAPEAGETPRPVAPARALVRDEVLQHDRLPALPLASCIAVVRDARISAATSTGQHE